MNKNNKKINNNLFKKYLNLRYNNFYNKNYILSLNKDNKKYINDINNIKILANNRIKDIENNTKKEIIKKENLILEKIFYELLPIIDNLERTISTDNNHVNNHNLKNLIIEGVKLTLISFINIIKNFKLEIIESKNVEFNPLIHQAISIIEDKKLPNNYVIDVLQKGYKFKNKLLRPAMVIVNKF